MFPRYEHCKNVHEVAHKQCRLLNNMPVLRKSFNSLNIVGIIYNNCIKKTHTTAFIIIMCHFHLKHVSVFYILYNIKTVF